MCAEVIISVYDNIVTFESTVEVGGFQITLSHSDDFTIDLTDDSFVSDYNTTGNSTQLIIALPQTEELFSYSGDMIISTILVSNLDGTEEIPAEIVYIAEIAGDVNQDGSLDILDVVLAVDTIMDFQYNELADINEDDILDVLDIIIMVNTIVNGLECNEDSEFIGIWEMIEGYTGCYNDTTHFQHDNNIGVFYNDGTFIIYNDIPPDLGSNGEWFVNNNCQFCMFPFNDPFNPQLSCIDVNLDGDIITFNDIFTINDTATCVTQIATFIQDEPYGINGTILDNSGEPIEGADIMFSYDFPDAYSGDSISVNYWINEDSFVEVWITDMCQDTISFVYSGNTSPGEYNAIWDGLDQDGKKVVDGAYSWNLRTSHLSGEGLYQSRSLFFYQNIIDSEQFNIDDYNSLHVTTNVDGQFDLSLTCLSFGREVFNSESNSTVMVPYSVKAWIYHQDFGIISTDFFDVDIFDGATIDWNINP